MLPTYCPAAGPWVPGEIRDCTLDKQTNAAGRRSGLLPWPGLRGAGAVTQLEGERRERARGPGATVRQPRRTPAAARVSSPSRGSVPGRALAPLPFARGRPCSLARLAFFPGCLPRKTRFCRRQNEVNLKNNSVAQVAKQRPGSLPYREDPGFCWEASEGSPGLSTVLYPISFERTILRPAYLMLKLAEGMGHKASSRAALSLQPVRGSTMTTPTPSLDQPGNSSHCNQLTSNTML